MGVIYSEGACRAIWTKFGFSSQNWVSFEMYNLSYFGVDVFNSFFVIEILVPFFSSLKLEKIQVTHTSLLNLETGTWKINVFGNI